MKVQLINAPLPEVYNRMTRCGAYPPLNYASLSGYLKDNCPNIEVEILDGEIMPFQRIIDNLNGDIIGLSPKILTYENSLEIAARAKQYGATVLMGGPHASSLFYEILVNQKCIDGIVIGDGEQALLQVVQGDNWFNIPNLAFKVNGTIQRNPSKQLNLNNLSYPCYSGFDMDHYFANFSSTFKEWGFKRAVALYSRKGCEWQEKSGGCIFCRKSDIPVRIRKPEHIWEEILRLRDEYNIDFVWDVSDNVTSNRAWLREFVNQKISNIDIGFLLYARVNEIDDDIINILCRLGCYEVLLGIESGSQDRLYATNKGISVNDSIEAIKKLSAAGIKSYPSFVLGLPGETEESALNTYSLAKNIVDLGNVSELACSILIPVPGSPAFDILRNEVHLQKKYLCIDSFSIEEMERDWVSTQCSVSYEFLKSVSTRIRSLVPLSSSFGSIKDEDK